MNTSAKKEIAVSFLQLASSGQVREAYERHIHPDFFHHNPYFKGDRASLQAGMEENAAEFPNKAFQPECLRRVLWSCTGGSGSSRICPNMS
jgi:hypothetical protein